jgi:Lsr2
MRSVTVTLVDDLDQAKADETVSFGLDGREYEIDLSRAHAGELRKMVSRYTAVARRARTAVRPPSGRRTQADRERSRRIRAWAVERGLMTSERGRIPEHVTQEYEATMRVESAPLRPSAAPEPGEKAARKSSGRKNSARRSARRPKSAEEPAESDE